MILTAPKPTYRKLAQRVLELEKSNHLFQRLIENSPDMIYRMSLPDGKYDYVSPAATVIFGYPPEAWYDNPFFIREILHTDWLSYFDEQLGNLLKGQITPTYEYKIIHKDQSFRWIKQRNVLIKNDDGCSEAIEGIVTDITDRKLADLSLQMSEERFSLVMDATKDGLWDWNVKSDEVYFSPAYSAMIGYASSEVPAHVRSWMDLIHPEDIDATLKANLDCKENRREQFEVEFRMLAKNGEWRWILGRGKAVARDKNGLATRMIGTHTDITERKIAEEQLREERWRLESIIEGTPGGTWEWNVQTGELVVNEMWARTLGYTVDELSPFSNNIFMTMVHPDDLEQSYNLLKRHFAGELTYYSCEFRMKHKNGHWIWIQDNGRLITHTTDGKPLMMFGNHIDISDRKLAEERIKQNLMEKETLLREIHHRVKNNMQVISSLLHLQATRSESQQVRQALTESQQRIIAMAMIHETLYGSQNFASIDLSTYLKNLVQRLQEAYSTQKDILIFLELDKVELDINQAVPCSLILNELITNAFKHAFPAGRKGTIQIKVYMDNDREVVLELSDNGVGLAANQDLSNPSTLGLKLVKGLLKKQLKGSLDIVKEGGTTFILRWPLPDLTGKSA
jgi:PAS domain S-box-containing protein